MSETAVRSSTTAIMSKVIKQLHFRLPKEIRPRRYDLYIHPDLEKKTFTGTVSIDLDLLKGISFIPLHAKKLTITDTRVFKVIKRGYSAPVDILQTFEYEPHEYWVTEFEKRLEAGQYNMKLSFNGSLTDRIVGLYQSSYFDKTLNETRSIATSKFEPTYARQAFPCFDEPAMKAKFRVTLVHPNHGGYHALSNMNVESKITSEEAGYTEVVFAESVPMSTYLACFVVSDFKSKIEKIDTGGIGGDLSMSVYATPEQLDKVDFALQAGVKIIEYYIQYFKIEYPLPKLDMIAIPDFVSGAMEHWGLVTFRETSLLYHPEVSSAVNKQRIGSVIAHELAHMWFGNLVTMAWWDDLWLNEGFATYITYKGLDHAEPSWKMEEQFIIEDLHGVLRFDSTLASHPIVKPVTTPDEITEFFDTITYSKGASIIRMLENFVGNSVFQTSVTNYLKKYRYGSAQTNDLLTEVDNLVPNLDVKYIMKTWTDQMGFPVVNVQKISNTEYKLTQKRFLSNPEDESETFTDSKFNYKWYIPITYTTSSKPKEPTLIWFKNEEPSVTISVPSGVSWIKINTNQVGYYRVNYEEAVWKLLAETLEKDVTVLSNEDRAHLLNDITALADATQLKYDTALDFLSYLSKETKYVPWSVAGSKLVSIKNNLYGTDIYEKYLDFARSLINSIYTSVGWVPDSDHLQNRLRTTILEAACSLGLQECLSQVKEEFNKYIYDSDKPHPDLRSTVYYYGMSTVDDSKVWDLVWNRFVIEGDASEKSKLMSALAAIQDETILKKYIGLAEDNRYVRDQDYFTCLQYISSNRLGEDLVWDYVRENWLKLVDRFGLNERYLGRMIPAITGRFSTQEKLQEITDFFDKYPEAGAGASARKQAIENVKVNIKWMEGNKDVISKWLNNRTK